MANKPLQSITFPGLPDKYTVPIVDDTLAITGAAADAKKVGDELSDVKSDLNQTQASVTSLAENAMKALDSDATGVDLDITDSSGNVIVRMADGHIQTKNFDSEDIEDRVTALEESPTPVVPTNAPEIRDTDAFSADLDLVDALGNVVVRFSNGHIKTKEFDSSNINTEELDALSEDVEALKSVTNGIVGRNRSVIDGIYAACRFHQPSLSSKQFCILCGGDVHYDATRMNSMVELLNDIDAFDAGIMLGDMSGNAFSDTVQYYIDAIAESNKPFLTVLGNHDVVGATSDADLWTKYGDCFQYAQLASGEAVANKCYYYKDFATYKIRIIVLMQYDYRYTGDLCYGQTQINWLISTLQSVPSDYGVIIALHTNSSRYMTYHMDTDITSDTWRQSNYAPTVMTGDPIPDIVDAWISGTSVTQTYPYTYSNPPSDLNVNADFTSRGTGEFITYLGGHWHMNVLGTPQNKPNQPDYHVPATGLSAATQGDMPRKAGTVSEDSLNVIAVDREKKTVKVFQIGAHFSKDAVERQFFKYSYGS